MMSNASGGDRIVFRDRVSELQDKLKKSEEERLRLEAQFDVMMNAAREEEATRLSILRGKYEKIVECEKRRRDRNDQILHTLDRIESRTAMIVAKSERLQLLRRHYEAYVSSIYPAWNGNAISYNGFTVPQIKPVSQFDHHPPRNGARSPNIQNDPLLFPLNPVKGAYISPYPTQKPYDLIPSALSQSHQMPVHEQTIPANPFSPSPQYSQQSIPVINQPFVPNLSHNLNIPYQQENIPPNQNLLYLSPAKPFPSPVSPKTNSPHPSKHFDHVDKTPTNEYRRRNLFPDEPYASQGNSENGVESSISGLPHSDVSRNQTNLGLNDYMKKTADLLNYSMREYGKDRSKTLDEEESKLANSTDFEFEQNTSGDILNISLSDDGILNQENSVSKSSYKKQEISDIAYDADNILKSRKVAEMNESGDGARGRGTPASVDSAKAPQGELGQGERPSPTSNFQQEQRSNENSRKSSVEYTPKNYKEEKFREQNIQRKIHVEHENGQEVLQNYEDRESYNQDIKDEGYEIGRDGFDITQEYGGKNKLSELKSTQYLENKSENINYKQQDVVDAEQYETSEQPLDEKEEHERQDNETEQLQEQSEYAKTESPGYVTESQNSSGQRNAEPIYEGEDQGDVVQEQTEYAETEEGEGYVTESQYSSDQRNAEPIYEAEDQGDVVQEQTEYAETEEGEGYVTESQYSSDQRNAEPIYEAEDQGDVVQEQTEYAETEEGEGYVTESQYASDQRNAEQVYATENQGQYVVQDQTEYAETEEGEGYVTESQYASDQRNAEQVYATENQGQYVVQDQTEYAETEEGEGYATESQYASDQRNAEQVYATENQGQYVVQDQTEYAETEEGEGYATESQYASDQRNAEQVYATENQGQYVVQDEAEYAEGLEGYATQNQYVEQQYGDQYQGPYETGQEDLVPQEEVQYEGGGYQEHYQEQDGQYVDENQYQMENQGQYGDDIQGQYVEGQNQYEEEQQYVQQPEQQVIDESQYEAQNQRQYLSERENITGGQEQYATENQGNYQEGYSEEAYQEYPQQPHQEYAEGDGSYQVENEWRGEQGDEVSFREGKYHEPTAGYERDDSGGEFLQAGAEGEKEMPESSHEQVYYDQSQEYPIEEQDENNFRQSQEYDGDVLQDLNHDTSISSTVEAEAIMRGKETSSAVTAKPRKSGLAMLESDTESSMHLGNAAVSNDDSDFDFSSGK